MRVGEQEGGGWGKGGDAPSSSSRPPGLCSSYEEIIIVLVPKLILLVYGIQGFCFAPPAVFMPLLCCLPVLPLVLALSTHQELELRGSVVLLVSKAS